MRKETNDSLDQDSVSVGGASTMPVTGACCGIRPSKEAMETDFAIDFSEAKQFLLPTAMQNTSKSE
ncbi:hypothetical protein HF888_03160 [Bermanella marisrubri]|uniref:Uncharacterized protein n=1 Tax=Bermanella marisrubri TaxID=207949 RepID=Q1N0J0_9GAMM|nr:hypothetical protein [Bermanella marisrubri]EAT11674.1 hypothetical protein RED65_05987 [Oceanobacter sp. RED65] [Bermanella marisrubri]QIZ83290.1 hypothetical protein HF888_03160 [Bermanella marisrubri]